MINKKGFVLMESLIVSIFVMGLFAVLYTSIVPLIGQYKSRENYDDIDSKYKVHWVRKMILEDGLDSTKNISSYLDITNCNYFTDINYCQALKGAFNISRMYLTTYNLKDIKESLINDEYIKNNPEFINYLEYLPNYTTDEEKQSYSRVIVEFNNTKNKTYGTIEVMR